MYLIRGLRADGAEVWYTGRAGDGWVSGDKREAFACLTLEGARARALNFNRMTALHGVRFVAVPRNGWGSLAVAA